MSEKSKADNTSQSEKKADTLDSLGFRLLKPGKSVGQYRRDKDQVMKANGKEHGKEYSKEHTEKSIIKMSYVPHAYIKANGINLKHFESKVYETLPKIEKLSVKVTDAMLARTTAKLAPDTA